MKLQTLRRGTAAAAVLTLSLSLAACGEEDEPATSGGDTSSESPAPEEEPAPEETESESAPAEPAADAPFGPACADVPTSGEGSVEGMVDDPVATAASNNPLVETTVAAVTAAGLVDTLNSAEALTVFAPANPAFEELGDTATQLIQQAEQAQDPTTSPLAQVLTHHVLPERLGPDEVTGEQTTLADTTLTIEGDPETVMPDVLCGNVQTANATVYVIGSVLTAPVA